MFLTARRYDFRRLDSELGGRYAGLAVNRGKPLRKGFRFGPYEVDVEGGELCKQGLRIRLQDKPFEVLVALLERPGEPVTREELRHWLWPVGISVEFENSLNSAVNRLRDALRDHARRPRYIETLHGRGYRFLAPVERVTVVPPRLAVLPFDSLSREPTDDFFADAVTDGLITELGNVSALRVISRQSVLHLKGTRRTAPEIARELKVDAIVEGCVAQRAGRIRATAQLVQAEPEQHLWAKAYECDVADLVTTQGQIARAIAGAVRVAMTPGELARLSRPRPVDPEAHVAYLKGRHHLGRWSRESLLKALEYFQLAVRKDSGHALAYAHLSDCYANLGFWGHMPFEVAYRKAKDAAVNALKLDEHLSTAHWAFGWSAWGNSWDLATCERETVRAIQLNPSDERAHELYSFFLATTCGDHARAVSEMRRALDLDPLSQRLNSTAAWIQLFVGDYERAIGQARKTLELFPEALHSYYVLGLAQVCLGSYSEGTAALEKATAISPDPISIAYLGCARARAGRIEMTLPLLDDLLQRREREHVLPRCFVYLYTALGKRDLAFDWLERAYEAHDAGLLALLVMPLYDPLRSDPRFQQMLHRLGIPRALTVA
jgi:TolB-like protein